MDAFPAVFLPALTARVNIPSHGIDSQVILKKLEMNSDESTTQVVFADKQIECIPLVIYLNKCGCFQCRTWKFR